MNLLQKHIVVSLDGILENLIAEGIVIALSAGLYKFGPDLLRKKSEKIENEGYDILKPLIFLTSLSTFNFILNISFWKNSDWTTFLMLSSIVLGVLTYLVSYFQCPSCKRVIKAKNTTESKILERFTKSVDIQPIKIWYYSNGKEWKRAPKGKIVKWVKKWVKKQDFYKCRICGYEWDSGVHYVNLDKNNRPEVDELINTNERDPNDQFGY